MDKPGGERFFKAFAGQAGRGAFPDGILCKGKGGFRPRTKQ